MDFKVLIAESAIDDLKNIVEFIAEDDRIAAANVGEKLLHRALKLATMPERFPLHDRSRGIRKMSAAPFLIFYVVDQDMSIVNAALLACRSPVTTVSELNLRIVFQTYEH